MTHWLTAVGTMLAVLACAPSTTRTGPVTTTQRARSEETSEPTQPAYRYYFDRNALRSSVVAGSSIVALTGSGHVLRFDRASLSLTMERFFERRARALGGATAATVLVGFEGGRIRELNVRSFALRPIVAVPGVPLWVGREQSGDAVVLYGEQKSDSVMEIRTSSVRAAS